MRADPSRRPWRWVGIQSAVAVVLRGDGAHREVLLIQRAERAGDPWSGHVSLPGGRRQPEDATLAQTARRETLEEVGLDLSGVPLVGWLPGLLTRAHSQRRAMSVHPAVFQIGRGNGENRVLSEEAVDSFWVPISALRDPASRARRPWKVGPVTVPAPAWEVDGHTIWGLTRLILGRLLVALP